MQSSASLSMAEGEVIAACDAAQIMLFVIVLEDIGLHVKKLMILCVDCKGAIDLTYKWNMSGLMKHASIKACFFMGTERGQHCFVCLDAYGGESHQYVYQTFDTTII